MCGEWQNQQTSIRHLICLSATPTWFSNRLNPVTHNINLPATSLNTYSHGTLFGFFYMPYVDDGAFDFEKKKDMETGSNLVFKQFNRFGLQMQIGSKSKPPRQNEFFTLPLAT